ncbi:PAS domain S-box protein [Deinococcus sonorensis]|uniref:PAS domain S-box protein n=2 Tax=Deinococcus sonorensis TaxID=309891 RepID=A0AAU7U6L2_9DEIO
MLWKVSSNLIVVLDQERRLIHVNPAAQAFFLGEDPPARPEDAEDWTVRHLARRVHPSDVAEVGATLASLTGTDTLTLAPFRARDARGAWRWLEGRACRLDGPPAVGGIIITLNDVTDRAADAARTQAVMAIASVLSHAHGSQEITQVILKEVLRVMQASAGSVLLLDEGDQTLVMAGSVGYPEALKDPWRRFSVQLDTPATQALRTGEDLYLQAAGWAALFPHLPHRRGAAAAIPLQVDGRMLGVLTLTFAEDRSFSPADRAFIRSLADQCAQNLQRGQLLEQMKASQARLRKLTEHSADFTLVLTLAGTLTFTTDASLHLIGYTEDQLVGQNVLSFIHPDDVAFVKVALERTPQHPGIPITFRFRARAGHWLWLEAVGTDHTADPDIGGILVNARDVTRTITLLQDLAGREAAFRHLFEHNPLPMCVTDIETLEILAVNDAAVDRYGYTREEFLALNLVDLRPAEDTQQLRAALEAMKRQPSNVMQVRHRRKNGELMDIVVHARALTFADRAARLAVLEDVTEQRRSERALRSSERKFRLLAENAHAVIIARNVAEADTYISPSIDRLIGYPPGEVARTPLQHFVHPEDRAAFTAFCRQVASGAVTPAELELRLRHAAGHTIWAHLIVTAGYDAHGTLTDYQATVHDITHRKTADQDRQAQQDRDRLLLDVTAALEAQQPPERIARMVLERCVTLPGVDAGAYLTDAGRRGTWVTAGRTVPPLPRDLRRLWALGRADMPSAGPVTARMAPALQDGWRSVMTQPVMVDHELVGAFILLSADEDLATETVRLLRTVTERMAVAMERTRHVAQLQQSREETLRAMGVFLEYRDYETKGHIDRVVQLTEAFARALAFPATELDALRWGAYLHDTGKVAISDRLLLKPGPLTDDEFRVVQQHPTIGHDMLRAIPNLPATTLDVVMHHHERWDGTGYPHGLTGPAIPVGARLFALVDVFDALISARPYKRAWRVQEALAEIERTSGHHFDPDLAAQFLRLIREGWGAAADERA